MARIGTSWTRIQAGDVISFKYKNKRNNKLKEQTILVLNPKFASTRIAGGKQEQVFHLIGLKLAEQKVRTIREGAKVVTQLFNKIGTIEAIDSQKDIYRVNLDKADLFWGGAKDTVYKKIRGLLGKEPIYRTYDYEEAKKSAVFYESLPVSEAVKRQFLGTKDEFGEREV